MSDASTTSLRRTMLRFVLPTIIAALSCAVAGTARAQNDANPEHIVVAEGVCKYRIVNPNFFDCDRSVMLMRFRNHRGVYIFHKEKHTWTFSGVERQPDVEDYYINIDTVRMDNLEKHNDISGECHSISNKDNSMIYQITCTAVDSTSAMSFDFTVTNVGHVERQDFR